MKNSEQRRGGIFSKKNRGACHNSPREREPLPSSCSRYDGDNLGVDGIEKKILKKKKGRGEFKGKKRNRRPRESFRDRGPFNYAPQLDWKENNLVVCAETRTTERGSATNGGGEGQPGNPSDLKRLVEETSSLGHWEDELGYSKRKGAENKKSEHAKSRRRPTSDQKKKKMNSTQKRGKSTIDTS